MANEKKSAVEVSMEEIQRELLLVQLEEGRERLAFSRNQKDARVRSRAATEEALLDERTQAQMRQDACPHRKGGTDEIGLQFGSDNHYSVIKHTLADGEVLVCCQRCQKQWRRPVRLPGMAVAEYKALLLEYQAGIALPTDNTPSGSQLFVVTREAA